MYIVSPMNKYTWTLFYKKCLCFVLFVLGFVFHTKDTSFVLFLAEYYMIETDIIRYYLILNSTTLKHCDQNYKYVAVQK